ncbi:MAG: RnfABCDGE type electron transport complex subunit D [Mariprofundales bacterium]|nr:RnfABCDGE type electron transport complex subunit D [Mariprofundales bacterium]
MITSSPHSHSGASSSNMMLLVIWALLPATLVAGWLYGWLALLQITTAMAACLATEWALLRMMKRPIAPLFDGSAALTGLFLALVLPAAAPCWMVLVGAICAMSLGKQLYGGLGYNPFNPALSARVILLISFPLQMTTWLIPQPLSGGADLYHFTTAAALFFSGVGSIGLPFDAITMATPLGGVKTALHTGLTVPQALAQLHYSSLDSLLGREGGSLGESSALALLVGGLFMLYRRLITWQIPLAYLATVALLAAVSHQIDPLHYASASFHLLAGGLMLCAFFMATDPVTSPVAPRGQLLFGIGCGVLTWVIRNYGGYPEGAMFAVVLMNCVVPLLDRHLKPRVYGQ